MASVKFWHEHYHRQNEPTCQRQDMTKGILFMEPPRGVVNLAICRDFGGPASGLSVFVFGACDSLFWWGMAMRLEDSNS